MKFEDKMFGSKYYRRDGTKIEGDLDTVIRTWGELHQNFEYKVVKQETLPNNVFVSTVWLGLDHGWGDGPPLIFETMAFTPPGEEERLGEELICRRYSTEAEALEGHKEVCERVRNWPADGWDDETDDATEA